MFIKSNGIIAVNIIQIPIFRGIYTDSKANYRVALPRNLRPIAVDININAGYLRPADGIELFAETSGIDRGGINWNGTCYRVIGSYLYSVNNAGGLTLIGLVAGYGQVKIDYSFDVLSISGGGSLYYFDGATFSRCGDDDLGNVIDHLWIDGYFMVTDGSYLAVTELNNRYSVLPQKYGSSEADPDRIKCLRKVRREVWAINRHTCEVFYNTGSAGFPFQRIDGAQVNKGAVGTFAACVFMEQVAFVGSGRNEEISVYIASNGQAQRISTESVDEILRGYTEAQLSNCLVESRTIAGAELLYIHLDDRTLVFDGIASKKLGREVWFSLDSGGITQSKYRARNFVYCYNKWIAGDPTENMLGTLSESVSSHYGNAIDWEIITELVYAGGARAQVHKIELVSLTGRQAFGVSPTVWYSYSNDGLDWTAEKPLVLSDRGDREFRPAWFRQGIVKHWRANKFRGNSDAFLSIAKVTAEVEVLNG